MNMIDEIQWKPCSDIERLLGLYKEKKYEHTIVQANQLLETAGTLTRTAERKEYCFGSKEEFLLYVFRDKKSITGDVVWLKAEIFPVHMIKAEALYELGEFGKAIDVLKAAIQNNPSSAIGRLEWVENLLRMGKYDEAEALLRETMMWVMYPDDVAKLYRRFGFCFIELKNMGAAAACLAWSLQFEKSDKALQELMYIHQSQEHENDPRRDVELLREKTSPRNIVRALHGLGLLFAFNDERLHLLLADSSQKGREAVLLYQKLGLIRATAKTEVSASDV